MARLTRALLVGVACAGLSGCNLAPSIAPDPSTRSEPPEPSASALATASATVLSLPTMDERAFSDPCAGSVPGGGVIAGDPRDERVVWIRDGGPSRIELVWPPGFVARLGSPIEIVRPDGTVIARVGDPAPGLCATQHGTTYFASLNR